MLLRWIHTLAETAKRGSMTAASRALHMTQPAVSQQLKRLQEELGARLYIRNGRGIELTSQGQFVLENSATFLNHLGNLREGLLRIENPAAAPSLRLGGSYSSSMSLLPKILAKFKVKHPQVDIDFRTDTNHALSQMVIDGEIEFAVVKAVPATPGLKTEMYRRETLVIFSLPTHPLTRKSTITVNELINYPWVIRNAGETLSTAQKLIDALARRGLNVSVALRCQTPAGVIEAVRKKIGLGLLYKSTIEANIRRGEFKLIRCRGLKLEGNSYIIYRDDHEFSPSAAEILHLMRRRPAPANKAINEA